MCVSVCVHTYMCAHKGRRLSLIAQAHLLILENRLASYRHKQYKNTQAQTDTYTRHKCLPQSLLLGLWTICIHSLAAVWTALTGMVYNMDSIVLGQRPLHSNQRSHYKTISLKSQGVAAGGQKKGMCVFLLFMFWKHSKCVYIVTLWVLLFEGQSAASHSINHKLLE